MKNKTTQKNPLNVHIFKNFLAPFKKPGFPLWKCILNYTVRQINVHMHRKQTTQASWYNTINHGITSKPQRSVSVPSSPPWWQQV